MGHRREKTRLRGIFQSETQTSLRSYRDLLENRNFACSKLRYGAFPKANNKGADQTLVCLFVVRKPPKTGFLAPRAICKQGLHHLDMCSTSSNTRVIRNHSPQSGGTAGILVFWLQVPGMTP